MAWEFAAGEILTAVNLNAVTLPWAAVCQVHDATQSVPDAVLTTIPFDSDEQLDDLGWHSNVSNPSRITPNITGWYRAWGSGQLVSAASTVTRLQANIGKNGSTTLGGHQDLFPAAVSTEHAVRVATALVQMNGSTDYFELRLLQDDSGSTARAMESYLTVQLVAPT